jgi:hypothetical protein
MKVKQSEGTDADGLGIPYPGYVDLKRNGSVIATIAEIRDYPELIDFVTQVNKADSFFRTLRSGDVISMRVNYAGGREMVGSYETIAFEILELNFPKNCYLDLYSGFVKSARDCTRCGDTFIEFKLIPTSYRDHGINRAWSGDFEIRGFGQTRTEARANWALGWRTVQKFLLNESTLWGAELHKGRVTVS